MLLGITLDKKKFRSLIFTLGKMVYKIVSVYSMLDKVRDKLQVFFDVLFFSTFAKCIWYSHVH